MIKKLIYYIKLPYIKLRNKIRNKKRLKELRKQDPFIYD